MHRDMVSLVESLRFNDTHCFSPTTMIWRRRVESKASPEENQTKERITRNMVSNTARECLFLWNTHEMRGSMRKRCFKEQWRRNRKPNNRLEGIMNKSSALELFSHHLLLRLIHSSDDNDPAWIRVSLFGGSPTYSTPPNLIQEVMRY